MTAGAIAALAVLAAGCTTPPSDGTSKPSARPPLIADLRDYRLDLSPGQTLEIRLPGNPSTGYRWVLLDPVPTMLRQTGLARERGQRSALAGAPDTEVWQFEADSRGNGVLQFEYRRTFEPPTVPPAQRASFRVHVR